LLDRHPYDALLPPAPPHMALKRLFFSVLRAAPAPSLVLIPTFRRVAVSPPEDPGALAAAWRVPCPRPTPAAGRRRRGPLPEALRAAAVDRIWQAVLDVETRR
jgi:hypothetical protein